MELDDILPPLPLEPPDDFGLEQGRAPPPPPLQTSSDAEVMDVSSGGDGYTYTPEDGTQEPLGKCSFTFSNHLTNEASSNPPCPRTARHAPPVTKFLPDLKLLRDVKISVSFTESSSSSSSSKDRRVLYTGEGEEPEGDNGLASLNGELHELASMQEAADEGSSGAGNSAGRKSEEAEMDMENRVEFAVLDELDDLYENLLEQEDGETDGLKSEGMASLEASGAFPYEVCWVSHL